MTFVQTFYDNLATHASKALVTEVHGSSLRPTSGADLAKLVSRARGTLRHRNHSPGDRAVLLAANASAWVAADLALLGEGLVVVPMYARQDPGELVEMMRDCEPVVVLCATAAHVDALLDLWPDCPVLLLDALFSGDSVTDPPYAHTDEEDVTIIYTSGTSGAAKGVVYQARNVDYMLPQTARGLRKMMGPRDGDDRVFHYLPFCFAGSRIVLWTCLLRGNGILVSTDLDNLLEEIGTAAPHYFLNVPMLLERIKNGVEANLRERPAPIRYLYGRAKRAWANQVTGKGGKRDRMVLALARRLLFRKVKAKIGPNLECLICGSAPLGHDTQRWFEMLDIPVYQVYGLTETTAIVTMDVPPLVKAGRVGVALEGVEMKLGDSEELLVRGPNVFARYHNRPEATAEAFIDGWFRTGDQAAVDEQGYWRIVGRVKNTLVPSSGHNVAPEPIEQRLVETIEGVEQAVVLGHGRPYLVAVVTGEVDEDHLKEAIDHINAELPHYRRIRRYHHSPKAFSIENGQLTANRKLRRKAIEASYTEQVTALYA